MMRAVIRGCARHRGGVAIVLTMALTVSIVAMFLVSYGVSAATGPKQVRGFVNDVDGLFIEDIPVVINIRWASDDTIRATLTDTSDANGYFSKSFGPEAWDIGDRIQVIATHGSNQVSSSVVADDLSYQWCNVTFPYAIPEFGSMIGFVVAGGLVAVVAVALLVWNRKK